MSAVSQSGEEAALRTFNWIIVPAYRCASHRDWELSIRNQKWSEIKRSSGQIFAESRRILTFRIKDLPIPTEPFRQSRDSMPLNGGSCRRRDECQVQS